MKRTDWLTIFAIASIWLLAVGSLAGGAQDPTAAVGAVPGAVTSDSAF